MGPTHISVQMESYPSVQTWDFGCFGPFLKGVAIKPPHLSLNVTLDNLHGQQWLHIGLSQVPQKSSSLLMPYSATLSLGFSCVKWCPETSKFFWGLFLTIILWTSRAIFINNNYKIFDVVMSNKAYWAQVSITVYTSGLWDRLNCSMVFVFCLFLCLFFYAEMFCTLKFSHFLSLASWVTKFPSFSGHWSFLKVKRIRQDRKALPQVLQDWLFVS